LDDTYAYYDFCTLGEPSTDSNQTFIPYELCVLCENNVDVSGRITIPGFDNTTPVAWTLFILLCVGSFFLVFYLIILLEKRDRTMLFLSYGVYTSHLKRANIPLVVLFSIVVIVTAAYGIYADDQRKNAVSLVISPSCAISYLNSNGTFANFTTAEPLFANFLPDNPSSPDAFFLSTSLPNDTLINQAWNFIVKLVSDCLLYIAVIPSIYGLISQQYQMIQLSLALKGSRTKKVGKQNCFCRLWNEMQQGAKVEDDNESEEGEGTQIESFVDALAHVRWKVSDLELNVETPKFMEENKLDRQFKFNGPIIRCVKGLRWIYFSNGLMNWGDNIKKEENFHGLLKCMHAKGRLKRMHEKWEKDFETYMKKDVCCACMKHD